MHASQLTYLTLSIGLQAREGPVVIIQQIRTDVVHC